MNKTYICTTLIATLSLTSCATDPDGKKIFKVVDSKQLSAMGLSAFEEIKSKSKVSRDARLQNYVSCVTNKLIAEVPNNFSQQDWEVVVFADDEPNAFALPGGKVGVNTGIWKVAQTRDQLAAVIGHELSHVTYQHSDQRVSTQLASAAAGQAGQILTARAGCNPAEAAMLWQNMLALSDGAPPQWLSTHPNSEKRMEKFAAQAPELQALAEAARSQGKGQACPR